ncbi:MAG: ABC transporter ATP-binding protein/permease [Coriobacteriia bacterium]|nr:ABC transporter ATP-binding protein/permease [Coriobacteriia bacterium]
MAATNTKAERHRFQRTRGVGTQPGGPNQVAGITAPPAQVDDFRGTAKKFLRLLKDDRWRLMLAALFALLGVTAIVFGPRLLAEATNELARFTTQTIQQTNGSGLAVSSIDFNFIAQVLAGVLCLYVLGAVFSYLQQRLIVAITQKQIWGLRQRVSEKLDRLPLRYFDKNPYGDTLSRITNDIDLINTNLQQIMTQSLTSVMMLAGILVMMFSINWALATISLIALPLALLMTTVVAPRAQRFFNRQQAQLGQLNNHIEESYSGHNIIKAFNREKIALETFRETNNKLYGSSWKAQFLTSILMPLFTLVTNIQYVLIVACAALLTRPEVLLLGINIGGLQIGLILAFIQYVHQFQQPLITTAQMTNLIQGTIAAAERVFELLEQGEEPQDAPDATKAEEEEPDQHTQQHQGAVSLCDVSFDYEAETPLIREWSLQVNPGQMIAIVGPTGAGKTTIVNLLMRFYEIDGGHIQVDGIDTRDMTRAATRELFGMVLQDTWLFSGTIRDNIAYGREGASEEEIIAAAQTAFADHFIRALPDGYDTILQEDAQNLSVGQRQLLTLARAVLTDAPIMILDEATSSVDTRTEKLIQAAMARLTRGRTSFVIAHRLSTIRDADLIVVMQNGRIAESGTHDELLAANGFYAELYLSQFAEDEA